MWLSPAPATAAVPLPPQSTTVVAPPITAQRQGEPAWHRRQRRARGNARALLRVAAAARLTEAHHSHQRHVRTWRTTVAADGPESIPMPNAAAGGKGTKGSFSAGGKGGGGDHMHVSGSGPRPGDWRCTICGIPDNRAWRSKCRNCEAFRNRAMAKAMEAASKPQPSLAERQLQQQKSAQRNQRRDDEEKRKLREANERMAAEIAAFKNRRADLPGDDNDDDEEMEDEADESYSAWSEEARAKRLELAKGGLAYAVERHGEDSQEAIGLRQEIASIQRASREAKPFKAHRAQLERRRDRLHKQQERDEAEIEKARAEAAELQIKIEALQTAVEDRKSAIKEVTAELTELVRRSLAEDAENADGVQPAGAPIDTPWAKMSTAIKSLEALPGIPAEFANLLARVQEAAAAMAAAAAPAAPQSGAIGSARPAAEQPADAARATPKPASANPQVVLAPHGRFAKPAAKPAAAGPPRAQTLQSPTDGGGDGGGARSGGNGGNSGTGTSSAGSAKPPGGGAAAQDSEAELVEDNCEYVEAGDPMQIDIEQSIAKLPELDQKKLRAALGRGRGRGRNADNEEAHEEGTRREDRERSPRPIKGAEDKEL